MSGEGLLALLAFFGAIWVIRKQRGVKVFQPLAKGVGPGLVVGRSEDDLAPYGKRFDELSRKISVTTATVENVLKQLLSPSASTNVLAGKLELLDEKIVHLDKLLSVHAELARMRLGMDHSDPEGALARLKADLETLRQLPGKRYEGLARKAGALVVEVDKVRDDYEISKLLVKVDAIHHSETSKALEKPR